MSNTYTLQKQGNESALVKNGNAVICPFIPPYPVQGAIGVQMQHTACNTMCPHAYLEDTINGLKEDKETPTLNEITVYSITCGCERISFEIQEPKVEVKVKTMFD